MKKSIVKILVSVLIISLLIICCFSVLKIINLKKEVCYLNENKSETNAKLIHYKYAFSNIISANILENGLIKNDLKVATKINDFGCSFCNNKVLIKLKNSIDKNKLLIILNAKIPEIVNDPELKGYSIVIDSVNFNLGNVEPVVFLTYNNTSVPLKSGRY